MWAPWCRGIWCSHPWVLWLCQCQHHTAAMFEPRAHRTAACEENTPAFLQLPPQTTHTQPHHIDFSPSEPPQGSGLRLPSGAAASLQPPAAPSAGTAALARGGAGAGRGRQGPGAAAGPGAAPGRDRDRQRSQRDPEPDPDPRLGSSRGSCECRGRAPREARPWASSFPSPPPAFVRGRAGPGLSALTRRVNY